MAFLQTQLWSSKVAKCIYNHETCQQLQAEIFQKRKQDCLKLAEIIVYITASPNLQKIAPLHLIKHGSRGEKDAFPLPGKEVQKASKAATQPTPGLGSKATDNQGWGGGREQMEGTTTGRHLP